MYGRIPYLNISLISWTIHQSKLRRLLYYSRACSGTPLSALLQRCLWICRGGVCWLRHFRLEVSFKGLLLCFGLFDKRLDILFWFWVSGRGSGSELREGGLLRDVSFNRDDWVLLAVLSWDGDGLFWHMVGWWSKIAWTRFLPISSLMGLVNIDPWRSITVLSERVVCSF